MEEEWKDIDGGNYEISNLGRVRSKDRNITYSDGRVALFRGKELRARASNGYPAVSLTGGKKAFVHRLVALNFVPNPDNLPQVNHKDGDKWNNVWGNLEWCTAAYNAAHARATGLNPQANENCNLTKYPEAHIRAMLEVKRRYDTPVKELSQIFGLEVSYIYQLLRGKARKSCLD